jgi:N-acetylneuraminic acid mutarotase
MRSAPRRPAPLTALLAAGLLAACSSATTPSPTATAATSPDPSAASPGASGTPPASATPGATPAGWRELTVADGPEAREDHTWTVAADGATALLFGGRRGDGTPLADLWSYDLAADTWSRLPANGPAARFGHNAAWVNGIGLVIFAGQAGATFFNDLWAYDPEAAAWSELPSGGDVPVERYGSCAAIGPDGRLWISHGFTAAGVRFSDTRAYDFAIGAWSDETPSGATPIERCLHACWWTSDGSLALYAGQTNGVTALGDLWHLVPGPRPGTNDWSEQEATPVPPERNLYAAARWGEATFVFGGLGADGAYRSDAWLLTDADGGAELTLDGPVPTGRSGAEVVADPARGRLLLFGGRNGDGAFGDLWELSIPAP